MTNMWQESFSWNDRHDTFEAAIKARYWVWTDDHTLERKEFVTYRKAFIDFALQQEQPDLYVKTISEIRTSVIIKHRNELISIIQNNAIVSDEYVKACFPYLIGQRVKVTI